MVAVIKTRTVLQHYEDNDNDENGTVGFDVPVGEAEGSRATTLDLDAGVWEEMGQPDRITVTIEPGDLLNV